MRNDFDQYSEWGLSCSTTGHHWIYTRTNYSYDTLRSRFAVRRFYVFGIRTHRGPRPRSCPSPRYWMPLRESCSKRRKENCHRRYDFVKGGGNVLMLQPPPKSCPLDLLCLNKALAKSIDGGCEGCFSPGGREARCRRSLSCDCSGCRASPWPRTFRRWRSPGYNREASARGNQA